MKKNYLVLSLLLFASICFGQTTIRTFNSTTDALWSTSENWSDNSIPTPTERADLNTDAELDVNSTIVELRSTGSASGGIRTLTGSGTLTIDDTSTGNTTGIRTNTDVFNINVPVIFNHSGNKSLNVAADNRTININSPITLNAPVRVLANTATRNLVFNAAITGNATLSFLTNSHADFAVNSDNSSYTGELLLQSDGSYVSSSSSTTGGFVAATSNLQVGGDNCYATLNTENIFDGSLNISGTGRVFTLNVNANQDSFNYFNFSNSGTININLDAAVTNLSFGNSSSYNIGTVNITGFEPGKIRFGTDNTGLTADQLINITADGDGAGNELDLDVNGYLVLKAPPLSVEENIKTERKRMSYPTAVENIIQFSKAQNDVKILSISGSVIKSSKNHEIQSLDVSYLTSGMYFIIFDNIYTEKFIKK